jgi:tetratricopeptide (TPR) repeat protein
MRVSCCVPRAVPSIGINLALHGEMGPASGWLGRAQRFVEAHGSDCAEQGYMLIPVSFQHEASGDLEGAIATAAAAVEIGERFHDADLVALALHVEGQYLVQTTRVAEGLARLDEAMVAVTTGELSPIATGIVYCGVILACEDVFELRRAREWTAVLTRWCEEQPDLIAFTGRCLVHRAQILRLQGDWREALDEARRAKQRCEQSMNQAAAAKACYLRGEVHRLRGEFGPAEAGYREASRLGLDPQPGWALLRLAEGNAEAAVAALRRATAEATERLQRAVLLPALVESALAVGDLAEAQSACDQFGPIADECGSEMLQAMLAHARGAVDLALGEPGRHSAICGVRATSGSSWRRLTRPRARGSSSARRAGRLVTTTHSRSSSRLRAASSRSSERGQTSKRSARSDLTGGAMRRTGSPTASWKCCVSSPAARRTARSLRSS